jgi:hypothetical protein
MNELEKANDQKITIVLEKLASLLEKSISIMEENRTAANKNHHYFNGMMKKIHDEIVNVSEDGIIEKSVNDSLKLLIESAKVLETPIQALTKVLIARIQSDAISKLNDKIKGPIDIESFK